MVGTSGITLNDLADELYISTSSLKNDLKLLKEKLHNARQDCLYPTFPQCCQLNKV